MHNFQFFLKIGSFQAVSKWRYLVLLFMSFSQEGQLQHRLAHDLTDRLYATPIYLL